MVYDNKYDAIYNAKRAPLENTFQLLIKRLKAMVHIFQNSINEIEEIIRIKLRDSLRHYTKFWSTETLKYEKKT